MRPRYFFYALIVLSLIAGCAVKVEKPAGKPVEMPAPSLTLILPGSIPPLIDDLEPASLETAIEKSLRYYEGSARNNTYRLGDNRISGKEFKESLLMFRKIMAGPDSDDIKQQKLRDTFDIYKATGLDGKGAVLFTGYFEPVMDGSVEKTEKYQYPIYKKPDDMVMVNLGKFRKKYNNERIVGRLKNGELVPYFTRADIEEDGSLEGRDLELVWVNDPIELFFLHIQGSGKIRLQDGKYMQVSYAQSNGHPNRMIGRYLLDKGKLSSKELTHKSLKKYLKEHPEEISDIFNYNESYVFFRIVSDGPVGALGLKLTAGRSIATDLDLFPRGALAFIRLRKPVFDKEGNIKTWESFSRFVLNQDTGGVIKGPGKVDLFCGTGTDAEMVAGSLKERGELFFLVKKKVNRIKPKSE